MPIRNLQDVNRLNEDSEIEEEKNENVDSSLQREPTSMEVRQPEDNIKNVNSIQIKKRLQKPDRASEMAKNQTSSSELPVVDENQEGRAHQQEEEEEEEEEMAESELNSNNE